MDSRRFVILFDIFIFLVIFHTRSYWFVTFRSFISYWSLILCEYQLWCSIKPWWTTPGPPHQNVEKTKNMGISFFQSKTFSFEKFRNILFENFIFCTSQRCSTKLSLTTPGRVHQNVENNHEHFEFSWKFGTTTTGSVNLYLRSFPWRKF